MSLRMDGAQPECPPPLLLGVKTGTKPGDGRAVLAERKHAHPATQQPTPGYALTRNAIVQSPGACAPAPAVMTLHWGPPVRPWTGEATPMRSGGREAASCG